MASAFIIQVDSQLQPNPGDETAVLLRILIYKMDNTTFGDNVPTLLKQTGPPPTLIHVQAILFASLVISLLSAFLAMLGKQWLNRYASTDMRGSAIGRSQNRQRKLDGIVRWYFDYVMESLPLMLQAGLLLLCCALSRYLWDVSIIVASVIVGITSLGVIFYLFIVAAGAASKSCPYQTPGSHIIRYLGPKFWNIVTSAPRNTFSQSQVIKIIVEKAEVYRPWWSRTKILPFFRDLVLKVPLGFAIDIYRLGQVVIRALLTLPTWTYHLVRDTNSQLYETYSALKQRFGQQATPPKFRCISWTLNTSLDKSIHLTTLEYLATMAELTGFDPTLVFDCFNVFVGCVSSSNQKLIAMHGLEQLAIVSARSFFRTFRHLRVTDPTSSVLVDLRRRYKRIFPLEADFGSLASNQAITVIHALVYKRWDRCNLQWDDYRPSGQEYISFARQLVEVAQMEYQRMKRGKVPRWILRFAIRSLSLDPPPPEPVVADCLITVAIDLDCDVSNVLTLDGRCVQI